MWAIFAVAALATGLAAARPALCLFRRVLRRASGIASRRSGDWVLRRPESFPARALQVFREFEHSRLLKPGLARQLLMLSAARFGVVVLMACQTASMTGAHIRFWHMAAAVPFASISNFVAFTPGGVGVNELASVTALHVFGTPLAVASQWALNNRLLAIASYFTVAAGGLAAVSAERVFRATVPKDKAHTEAEEVW